MNSSRSLPLSYGTFSILIIPNLEQALELTLGAMPRNLAPVPRRKL